MWDSPNILVQAARLLNAIAVVLLLYGIGYFVMHLPIFPINQIRLQGDLTHVTRNQVEAIVARELRGNFFTINLTRARLGFEKLPWVRQVRVKRIWPDRLEIGIEEHLPLARWQNLALINTYGEVFEAATNLPLPVFYGPRDSAMQMTLQFDKFQKILMPVNQQVRELYLNPRQSWRIQLTTGTQLELGRQTVESRLKRWVATYPVLQKITADSSIWVDLRYPNGLALRLSS